MKINRAMGVVIVIVALRILVPHIYHAMEGAFVSLFRASQASFDLLEASVEKAGGKISIKE